MSENPVPGNPVPGNPVPGNPVSRIDPTRRGPAGAAGDSDQDAVLPGQSRDGVARLVPRSGVRPGGRVTFRVDPSRLYFFDPATGEATAWPGNAIQVMIMEGKWRYHAMPLTEGAAGSAEAREPRGWSRVLPAGVMIMKAFVVVKGFRVMDTSHFKFGRVAVAQLPTAIPARHSITGERPATTSGRAGSGNHKLFPDVSMARKKLHDLCSGLERRRDIPGGSAETGPAV